MYWFILTWNVKVAGIVDWKCWIMKDIFKNFRAGLGYFERFSTKFVRCNFAIDSSELNKMRKDKRTGYFLAIIASFSKRVRANHFHMNGFVPRLFDTDAIKHLGNS